MKLYGRVCFSPAGISTSYRVAVKLRTIRLEAGALAARGALEERAPPTIEMVTGSASSLENESSALEARLLTSFTPKISASGNAALTLTAKFGVFAAAMSSSRV